MNSDFDLLVYEFNTKEPIKIIPISDVHLGSEEHMEEEWTLFCKKVKNDSNAFITLGGDLLNNTTRSSIGNIWEERIPPSRAKKMMSEMLAPLRDKILCSVVGNHENRTANRDCDDDPTYDIMCKLDLEDRYRKNIAFLKIRTGNPNGSGTQNPTYTLAVTHGVAGGTIGNVVNSAVKFGYAIDGLDALIVGHSHKPIVTQTNKMVIDKYNNKVSFQPFKVISSTSWLDYGGYAAQKMLTPSSFALQTIQLSTNRKEITVTM